MNDPVSYAGRVKYTKEFSRQYQKRRPSRDLAEQRLVIRALQPLARGTVLDAPCGGGRMSMLLASEGFQPTAADLSPAMVEIAGHALREAGLTCSVEVQDLEHLTHADDAFDGILCFRFFHHLPSDNLRARVIAELCRVARSWVVISYFNLWSFSSLRREWHRRRGKAVDRYATTAGRLAQYFAPHHFVLAEDYAQARFRHTLHVAVFRRAS